MVAKLTKVIRFLIDQQTSLSVSYLVYTIALGFSGILQLGLIFFLTRLLPANEFGVVALLMVSIPLLSRFVTLGSDIGLAIRIWKRPHPEQAADLASMLTLSAVTVGTLLVGLIAWVAFSDIPYDPIFMVAALMTAAFRDVAEVFQFMMRREGHVAKVGLFICIRALLFAGGAILAVHLLGRSAFAVLVGMLVAEGLGTFWALYQLTRLYPLRLFAPGSMRRMTELTRIGFPSIPGTAAVLLLGAGDRFVISAVIGLTATGVYALGQRLAESVVQILFVPFSSAFGPHALRVAASDKERGFLLISQTARTFAYLGGVVLGLPTIVGREVILIISGAQYAPAADVFLLVVPAVLIFQISQILSIYFSHTENLRKYMWIVVVGATANIILNYVAVKAMGILGAAVASLIVYEAMLIAVSMIVRRGGSVPVSLRALHMPLILFGTYLGIIYYVDSQGFETALAIATKALAWLFLATTSAMLSAEFRAVILGVIFRFRSLRDR